MNPRWARSLYSSTWHVVGDGFITDRRGRRRRGAALCGWTGRWAFAALEEPTAVDRICIECQARAQDQAED